LVVGVLLVRVKGVLTVEVELADGDEVWL